jgi:hypothetical protein
LFTGLGLLIFVLMYFATGYVMIHPQWFNQAKPNSAKRIEALTIPSGLSNDQMSLYLQEKFDLHGKRTPASRKKDGTWRFNYLRPGTTFEALVSTNGQQVTITEQKFAFAGVMSGLHRQKGYGGGALYDVWSLAYDLASAALVVFAASGVFLWWKSTANRLPGWICLACSLGLTSLMVAYLMLRK